MIWVFSANLEKDFIDKLSILKFSFIVFSSRSVELGKNGSIRKKIIYKIY